MSSQSDVHSSIIVPTTFVKKPGFLKCISDVTFTPLLSQQPTLQTLLEDFRMKSDLDMNFQDESSQKAEKPTKRASYSESSESVNTAVLNYYSENSVMEPGKIKRFSDEISNLMQIAQQVLFQYDIKFTIEASTQHSKKICNLLKFLIPEISFFSTNFFKSLNIKEFVFCEEEVSYSEKTNPTRAFFHLKYLDSQPKVHQRLYRIIFNQLVLTNPQLLKEWREFDCKVTDEFQSLQRMEKTFLLLMTNLKRKTQIEELEKLRELLNRKYPEMSEEWFKNKGDEARKNTKVTFNF